MSGNSTELTNNNGIQVIDSPLSRTIKFWLFMVVASASMSCYLFVTYQLLAHRALRQALHNHAILVNLCFNTIVVMIDLPFILSYLYLGHVLPATAGYCLIWQFIDYGIWFTDILGIDRAPYLDIPFELAQYSKKKVLNSLDCTNLLFIVCTGCIYVFDFHRHERMC